MISGKWFQRKRYFKNWQKVYKKYPILIVLVGVLPSNINTKFEANVLLQSDIYNTL